MGHNKKSLFNWLSKLSIIGAMGFTLFVASQIIVASSPLYAQAIPAGCPGGPAGPPSPGTICPVIPTGCPGGPPGELAAGVNCPDTSKNYDPVTNTGPKPIQTDCNTKPGETLTKDNCGIVNKLITFINVLSAMVGIVVVLMIVIGGIQYSASADNPQATAAAKKRIANAILALVVFLFMFAFLQWVVPGGVF